MIDHWVEGRKIGRLGGIGRALPELCCLCCPSAAKPISRRQSPPPPPPLPALTISIGDDVIARIIVNVKGAQTGGHNLVLGGVSADGDAAKGLPLHRGVPVEDFDYFWVVRCNFREDLERGVRCFRRKVWVLFLFVFFQSGVVVVVWVKADEKLSRVF